MKALILAAGYATRLYPLTKEYPKPLLEVNNRPVINYITEKLLKLDALDEIFVVTNSRFFEKFNSWRAKFKRVKKLSVINDLTQSNKTRLGAIGDVHFAVKKRRIKDDLLVIGGDNLFSRPLNGFVAFARRKCPAVTIGLYRLRRRKDASRYGAVTINKHKLIKGFVEKPSRPESNLVAMCLYYLPADSLRLVAEYMRRVRQSDATGGYISWLRERIDTYGFVFGGSWFDIGDLKYLKAAKYSFARKEKQ